MASYSIKKDRRNFETDFEKKVWKILSNEQFFQEERTKEEWKDLYRWAYGCVMSRSFGPQSDPPEEDDEMEENDEEKQEEDRDSCCYPLIDFINGTPASFENVELEITDNEVSIVTNQKIGSGEQLFLNYGEKSNGDLLQMYGFTFPKNPNLEAAIDITTWFDSLSETTISCLDRKIEFLIDHRFLDAEDRIFYISGSALTIGTDTTINLATFDDDSLLVVLKVIYFDEEEFDMFAEGDIIFNPIQLPCANITLVNQTFHHLINQVRLKLSPSKSKDDSELTSVQKQKKHAADIVKENERNFLGLLDELVDCILAPLAW